MLIHTAKKIIHLFPFPSKIITRKNRAKLTAVSLGIIIFLLPIVFYTIQNAKPSQAAWFDSNWAFRQIVAITNAGTAQTDYQIAITLDTATLITAGKMRSDCADIRIADANGKVLPLWIEKNASSACNTSTTKIWTKVPSIPTSGIDLYIYYGNSSAINAENGKQTFLYFDDFNSNNLNNSMWSLNDTSSQISQTGGKLVFTTGTSTWTQAVYLKNPIPRGDTAMEFDYQWTSNNASYDAFMFGWKDDGSGFSYSNLVYGYYNPSANTCTTCSVNVYEDGTSRGVVTGSWIKDTNYKVAVRMRSSGGAYYDQSTDGGTNWTNSYTSAYSTESNLHPAWMFYSGTHNIDNFFVRKDAPTPPTVASPASEEAGSAPLAYWKFDDGTGTGAKDSSPNGNNGGLGGATPPTWQKEDQCISGKCLFFDGSTSKVTISQSSIVNGLGSGDFTLSTWVKIPSGYSSNLAFITKRTAGGAGIYFGAQNTTSILVYGSGWGTPTNRFTASIRDGKWHHLEAVRSGTNVMVYVDGLSAPIAAGGTGVSGSISNSQDILIGKDAQVGDSIKGQMDEVKIYSYARSTSQVKTDFISRGSRTSSGTILGASNANQNLSNGLVGYWKMDEATWSGTLNEVVDSSGNAYNGTRGGSATTGIGKYGNGGSFANATSDRVDFASSILNTPPYTVCMWANPTTVAGSTYRYMIANGGETGAKYGYYLYLNNVNSWQFGVKNSSGLGGSAAVAATSATWTHVCGTWDGSSTAGSIKLYINGMQVASGNPSGSGAVSAANLKIGGATVSESYEFDGKLDETRIYNRALSPSEVSQIYNYAPGPNASWSFEEGQGGTVNDTSGNGNTGAWSGSGSHWTSGKYGSGGNFNGTNDYVRSTHSILDNSGAATISFWMKIPVQATNFRRMLSDSSTNGIALYFEDNGTHGLYGNFGDATYGWLMLNPDLTGGWHYITLTASSSDGKIYAYLDGKLAYSRAGSFTTLNLQDLYIGSSVGTGYFLNGALDEIKIYNYARTPGQIVSDMNASHPLGGSPVGSQVGYWKFDEGYGGTNYNSGSGGHTYDGTITSATFTTDGKFGKAMSFDGTTGKYVSIPAISSLASGNPFTISAWVRPGSTGTYRTIAGYDGTHRLLISSTGQMLSQQSGNFFSNAAGDVPDNQWTYVAYTFDGTQEKWYINGKQSGSAHVLTTAAWSSAFKVGQYDNVNYPYKGFIDELKIYGAALSDSEIKLDYNRGSTQVLGSASDTSGLTGGSVASSSASSSYCVPGDTSTCSSPIGDWEFEEGAGGTVNDLSGNGNTGTWNGTAPYWTQGKYGSGGNFNGTNNYVDAGNGSLLSFGAGALSMSAWVKTSYTGQFQHIAGKRDGATTWYRMGVAQTTGKFFFELANSYPTNYAIVNGTSNVADGAWHFVEATRDGSGNLAVYVDGVKQNTGSANYNVDNAVNFKIGAYNTTSNPFNGKIDQVRIYNYARTPAQAAWDYNRGGPQSYWKFDECQGNALNDSAGGASATLAVGASGTQTSSGTCSTAGTAWANGASGKYNYSINFDGSDDNATASDPNLLKGGGLTLSAWYKTSSTVNYNTIFNRGPQGSANGFVWFFFDNSTKDRLWYQEGNASYCSIKSNASSWSADGNWHNLAVTQTTTGSVTFYKDGNVIGTGSCTWQDITNTTEYIGTYNGSAANTYTLTGQLDDLRLYNYPLTKDQIKQVYNQGGAVRFGPTSGTP